MQANIAKCEISSTRLQLKTEASDSLLWFVCMLAVQSCEFEYDCRVFRCTHRLVVQLRVATTHNTTS